MLMFGPYYDDDCSSDMQELFGCDGSQPAESMLQATTSIELFHTTFSANVALRSGLSYRRT